MRTQAYPQDEAVAAIAAHIRSFWDPRRRAGLEGYIAGGGEGVQPVVLAAMKRMEQAA